MSPLIVALDGVVTFDEAPGLGMTKVLGSIVSALNAKEPGVAAFVSEQTPRENAAFRLAGAQMMSPEGKRFLSWGRRIMQLEFAMHRVLGARVVILEGSIHAAFAELHTLNVRWARELYDLHFGSFRRAIDVSYWLASEETPEIIKAVTQAYPDLCAAKPRCGRDVFESMNRAYAFLADMEGWHIVNAKQDPEIVAEECYISISKLIFKGDQVPA